MITNDGDRYIKILPQVTPVSADFNLFQVIIETLEKGVKYVQS